MFELLMSADMMVPDPDGMTEKLVDKLGIYKHERWRQAFDNRISRTSCEYTNRWLSRRLGSSRNGTWICQTRVTRCSMTFSKA